MRVSTCEKCAKRCSFFSERRYSTCSAFISYSKAAAIQKKRDDMLLKPKMISKGLTYKPFEALKG